MTQRADEVHTLPAVEEVIPPAYKRLSHMVMWLIMTATVLFAFAFWELAHIGGLLIPVVRAEFNYTQARIISQAQARQNSVIYSSYLVNQRLADGLSADETLAAEQAALLEQASLLASNSLYFLPTRYLQADGGYDFERNASEVMAELGRRTTLDSAPLRATADLNLQRRLAYLQVQFIMGITLAVLAFEEIFYWRRLFIRIPLILIGVALLLAGTLQYLSLSPNPISALLR